MCSRSSRAVQTVLHRFQDHLLGLFQARGATADLDRLTRSLLLGHVDGAAGLLADGVDLAAALADDETVGLGVWQDEEAGGGLLRSGGDGLLDDSARLGDILRGAGQNPGVGGGGSRGSGAVNDGPGVGIGSSGGVISDQGHGGVAIGASLLGGVDGRNYLAGVVDADLVVVAQAAEDGAVVRDGVVQVAGDLDGLSVLLLEQGLEVLLGAFHGGGGTLELDIGAAGTLLGDIQSHVELGLNTAAGVTSAADEQTVVSGRDVDDLGDLVLAFLDKLLDGGDDAVDNLAVTLQTNGGLGAVGLGEADHSGGTAVGWATSLSHDLADVGACRELAETSYNRAYLKTYHHHQ